MIPLIAVSISERLRDRGYDICICFDDLSKHSKAYRQCSRHHVDSLIISLSSNIQLFNYRIIDYQKYTVNLILQSHYY